MLTGRVLAYLVGLALGYWVLTLAEKEKNFNKKLGKFIGWVILVVSILGPLCLMGSRLACHQRACSSTQGCYWGHPGMTGPGSQGTPDLEAPADKK